MNKSKKLKLVILAFIISTAFVSTIVMAEISDNSPVPGSAQDPLVTLRYVTEVLKPQIQAEILAAMSGADVSEIIAALQSVTRENAVSITNPENINNSNITNSSSGVYNGKTNSGETLLRPENETRTITESYELVELTIGQKIESASGSIELIARQGTIAVAVSPYETQGIGDLTEGAEILDNQRIPINHSLLIPRADGRAVQVISDIAFIMVRGDYKIVD